MPVVGHIHNNMTGIAIPIMCKVPSNACVASVGIIIIIKKRRDYLIIRASYVVHLKYTCIILCLVQHSDLMPLVSSVWVIKYPLIKSI